MSASEQPRLHEVRILRLPLDLQAHGQEHHEELMREFQLLAIDPPTSTPGHQVPKRLIDLVDELTTQYAGVAEEGQTAREAARARGESEVDLVFHVPAEVAGACINLREMLEEADDFCRAGERLLTLATPPELVEFRNWYLGEFVAQVGGEPPTTWPDYHAAHGAAAPPTP